MQAASAARSVPMQAASRSFPVQADAAKFSAKEGPSIGMFRNVSTGGGSVLSYPGPNGLVGTAA
jgi:hypothetical protein